MSGDVFAAAPSGAAQRLLDGARATMLRYNVCAATSKVYAARFAEFERFCEAHGFVALPASAAALLAFQQFLVESGRGRSARHYLNAITKQHVFKGIQPPRESAVVSAVARSVLARANIEQPLEARDRLPFRPCHVSEFVRRGALRHNRAYEQIGLELALAVRTARRPGELCGILREHVRFSEEGMSVLIKQSKTDKAHEGFWVHVQAAPSTLACPVRLMRRHLAINGIVSGTVFRHVVLQSMSLHLDRPLAGEREVNEHVMFAAYDVLGLQGYYRGHSVRIGGVTAMLEAGIEWAIIQVLCNWASQDSVKPYAKFAGSAKGNISRAMGFV